MGWPHEFRRPEKWRYPRSHRAGAGPLFFWPQPQTNVCRERTGDVDVAKAEREREELYMTSVRRHHARRQEELCWAWLRWHERMLSNHTKTAALIAAHHRGEIQKYEQLLGTTYPEPNGKDAA